MSGAPIPVFDAQRFIADHFKHHSRIRPFLKSYGLAAPDAATVEKWYYRNSIPAVWLVTLLVALEMDERKPISLAPYLLFPGG
jgi:hypothetical protein